MATISDNKLFKALGYNTLDEVMTDFTPYQFSKFIHTYIKSFYPNDNVKVTLDTINNKLIATGSIKNENSINVDLGLNGVDIFSLYINSASRSSIIRLVNDAKIIFKLGDLILVSGIAGYNNNGERDEDCDLILKVISGGVGDNTSKYISIRCVVYNVNNKELEMPQIPKGTKLFKIKNGLLSTLKLKNTSDILNKMTLDEWEDFVYNIAKYTIKDHYNPKFYRLNTFNNSNDPLTLDYFSKDSTTLESIIIECSNLSWGFEGDTDINKDNPVVNIVLTDKGESSDIIKVGDLFMITYSDRYFEDPTINYAGLTASGTTYKHKILEVVEVKEDSTFLVKCINSDNCLINSIYKSNLFLIKA